MAEICPTLLATNAEDFTAQLQRLEQFAGRLHIDLMDGKFAKTTSVQPDQIWWPGNLRVDLHVMYQKPFGWTDVFVALGPQLVIVHAEAEGDFTSFAAAMHHHGIETGVALLPETPVASIAPALDAIDHVLVFSGNLGYYGGKADPALLPKIRQLRQLKPTLEIGWDGGVNARNAPALAKAGVDVLNAGGFISHAEDPQAAYGILESAIGKV